MSGEEIIFTREEADNENLNRVHFIEKEPDDLRLDNIVVGGVNNVRTKLTV